MKPYLKAQLDQGNIEIKCPNKMKNRGECEKPIQHRNLYQLLSHDQLTRWNDMMLARGIDTMDDASWCPTPGCAYAFIKNSNKLDCPLCQKQYCLDCRTDWHHGMKCIEYKADQVNKQDDSEVIEMIRL